MSKDYKPNYIIIPLSIWLDKQLSIHEKVIFAQIDNKDGGPGKSGCVDTNADLCEFSSLSGPTVTRIIRRLVDLTYIRHDGYDNRKRVLRSNVKIAIRPNQNDHTNQIDYPRPNQNDHTNQIDYPRPNQNDHTNQIDYPRPNQNDHTNQIDYPRPNQNDHTNQIDYPRPNQNDHTNQIDEGALIKMIRVISENVCQNDQGNQIDQATLINLIRNIEKNTLSEKDIVLINNIINIYINYTSKLINNNNVEKEKIPYKQIIDRLNHKAGTKYRSTTTATRKLVQARWHEGHRLNAFLLVIDFATTTYPGQVWTFKGGKREKAETYLRPKTLFNGNFDDRYNKALTWEKNGSLPSEKPTNTGSTWTGDDEKKLDEMLGIGK